MFLTQVHQFGIRKTMHIYAAFYGAFMAPFVLSAMPKEAADAVIGEINTVSYSPLLDTDANKKFLAEFRQKFAYTPDDEAAMPYDAGNMLVHALQATGGDTTPEKLREAILGVNF